MPARNSSLLVYSVKSVLQVQKQELDAAANEMLDPFLALTERSSWNHLLRTCWTLWALYWINSFPRLFASCSGNTVSTHRKEIPKFTPDLLSERILSATTNHRIAKVK